MSERSQARAKGGPQVLGEGSDRLLSRFGEHVRGAVEAVLEARQAALVVAWQRHDPELVYAAVCRLVMRIAAVAFAEARGHARGLGTCLAALQQRGSESRERSHGAWARVLAVLDTGGLCVAESGCAGARAVDQLLRTHGPAPSDEASYQLLASLARQGQGGSLDVNGGAVLPSESLGIVYEGLLDYRLHEREGKLSLVRWRGTRKGAGSFYTPPELSMPTLGRTLAPLLREEGVVRRPEQLLALKICDPAMGAGSFLIAGLRLLSAALLESLHVHARIEQDGPGVKVEFEDPATPAWRLAGEDVGALLEARVRRAVAERCLYGVDLDPIAVELTRVSLWIDAATLAPQPPSRGDAVVAALGHTLRCGDALLGAWRDQVEHYPLLALGRACAGADKRALGHKRAEAIRAQVERLRAHPPPAAADHAASAAAFDTWCALWFWPLDELDTLPLPGELDAPCEAAQAVVKQVRERGQFFHWEVAFPEVFTRNGAGLDPGFDAIVGNPPWAIQKPNSKSFFSRYEPEYRGYGKQAALRFQRALFESRPQVEARWRRYARALQDRSHFVRHAGEPFGDAQEAGHGGKKVSLVRGPEGAVLHRLWRALRRAEARPFRHQGPADLNSYKLFVELGHALVREGGQLGLVVPSGLYTDRGTRALRELLLQHCRWRWLYGFENRNKLFEIDGRFKFCVLIAEKGGQTKQFRAAFMRLEFGDWVEAKGALEYPSSRLRSLSPHSSSVVEIRSVRELELLSKLHAQGVALDHQGEHGWGIAYTRELDMTTDSALFVTREQARARGFESDRYGRWVDATGSQLLPVYEGRMIGQFDFCEKAWVSGKGRTARWRAQPWSDKQIEPQYLLPRAIWKARSGFAGTKLGFMAIGSATNQRSMFAAVLRDVPCGNAVPVLRSARGVSGTLALAAVMNSFAYDFALRARLGGLNLNHFVISETALIPWARVTPGLIAASARLSLAHRWFAPSWAALHRENPGLVLGPQGWALTRHERLRLRSMIDAIVAACYGLTREDLSGILSDCDHPMASLANKGFCRQLDPKGLWRVDRSEPPELRLSVLSVVAFDALQAVIARSGGELATGIEAFCRGEDGRGWQLPVSLCVAQLGLRRSVELGAYESGARVAQPVRARLGPQFMAWQRSLSPARGWAQCLEQANLLLGSAS